MSSPEFDILRARHPAYHAFVSEMETILARTLRKDPEAVIDDRVVVQELRSAPQLAKMPRDQQQDVAEKLLLELVSIRALRTVFLWICANGFGTVRETETLSAFPSFIFCERCGEAHPFSRQEVEVHFLPTADLIDHLLAINEV